jgi:hypothetical protein
LAGGLRRMFPWFDLCAIGYQPYANLARLVSLI